MPYPGVHRIAGWDTAVRRIRERVGTVDGAMGQQVQGDSCREYTRQQQQRHRMRDGTIGTILYLGI